MWAIDTHSAHFVVTYSVQTKGHSRRFAPASKPYKKTKCLQSNSSMHHYECIALCKDISLPRGWFCTRSLASCIPRSSKDRSSRMFFIQVVRGRPGGRLQFFGGGSKMAWLASAFSSIRAKHRYTTLWNIKVKLEDNCIKCEERLWLGKDVRMHRRTNTSKT